MKTLKQEIEDLKIEVSSKIKELESKIEKESTAENVFIPELNQAYYYFFDEGHNISRSIWRDADVDMYRLYHKKVFETLEEAKRYRDVDFKYHKIAFEMKQKNPLNWDDSTVKEYIFYQDKVLYGRISYLERKPLVYAPNGFLKELLKEISGEDLIWYIKRISE